MNGKSGSISRSPRTNHHPACQSYTISAPGQGKATTQVQGLAAFRLCPRHRQAANKKAHVPAPRRLLPAARRPCQAFTTHSPSSSLNSSSSLLLLINTGGEQR